MTDKWEAMRLELAAKTVKELKQIAKEEGITLGYDASRKDSCVGAIVTNRRYRELNGEVPDGHDWHDHGVTAYRGIVDNVEA